MIWFVAVGSAVGGVLRYLVGVLVQSRVATPFPVGTLLINVTGSLILGFLLRWTFSSTTLSPDVRAMLTVGFCGGFTTFSAFSIDTVRLLQNNDYGRAAGYVGASVALSILATFGGIALAGVLNSQRV